MTTRKQFAAVLAGESERAQAWGRNILANLKIIENPRSDDNDREAARVQLGKNYVEFEKARNSEA